MIHEKKGFLQKGLLQDTVAKEKNRIKKLEENDISVVNNGFEKEKKELEGKQSQAEKKLEEKDILIGDMSKEYNELYLSNLELQNENIGQDIDMRRTYASKAYRFVWLWSIALIVILILDGSQTPSVKLFSLIEIKAHDFQLGDNVLIALISGVTINIVAVFVVVIRNLFPSNIKNKRK